MPIDTPATLTALPISFTPLVPFDALTKVRRDILQSVVVAMPPHYLPTDPSAHLFQPPIQIVVLGIEEKQVELGIHCDSFLHLQQGPPPNSFWVEHWQRDNARKGS